MKKDKYLTHRKSHKLTKQTTQIEKITAVVLKNITEAKHCIGIFFNCREWHFTDKIHKEMKDRFTKRLIWDEKKATR